MSRTPGRVDMYANVCWQFLAEDHLNEAFLLPQIIRGVKQQYGVTLLPNRDLHVALASRCREHAIADGLFLPYPCPYNSMTWAVTNDPDMVFDARMHCYKVRVGWGKAEDKHADFIRRNLSGLSSSERKIVQIVDQFRQTQQQAEQQINALVGVAMDFRRQARKTTVGEGEDEEEI